MTERRLWLRSADAELFAATSDDVVLLLEFLEAPAAERHQIAAKLRDVLDQAHAFSRLNRDAVSVLRPLGMYVILPRAFAGWLADALVLPEDEIVSLSDRLTCWLAGEIKTGCCATESAGLKAE